MNIEDLLQAQRAYFQTGKTLPVAFRQKMLKKLYQAIQQYEQDIMDALKADLGKSDYEAFMCEIGLTLSEISYMRRHLRRFAREKRVRTPLAQFSSRSYVKPSPYGTVLIMSPWNYPLLLTLEPLVDAIAAGNTAVVKPSAYSPATSSVIEKMLRACFPPEYVAVVTGGREENTALLDQKFDMIFFTGSQAVGKEVLRRAAEHLTPVVLELGGKSPCIVDETADISLAARRIVFGKFLNCGQTCVAPDYILCHEGIQQELLNALCHEIQTQFGSQPLQNPDYGKIISQKHFHRIRNLISYENYFFGGGYDQRTQQIAPTVLTDITWEDPIMEQEIFGPVLPVLTYRDMNSVYEKLAERPKPLALYLFSTDPRRIQEVTSTVRFGGGCINDVVIHLATSAMAFGGVGESGMGGYHGKTGFEAFSHSKSIVHKKNWLDLPMRYQPYRRGLYGKLLRLFLR